MKDSRLLRPPFLKATKETPKGGKAKDADDAGSELSAPTYIDAVCLLARPSLGDEVSLPGGPAVSQSPSVMLLPEEVLSPSAPQIGVARASPPSGAHGTGMAHFPGAQLSGQTPA